MPFPLIPIAIGAGVLATLSLTGCDDESEPVFPDGDEKNRYDPKEVTREEAEETAREVERLFEIVKESAVKESFRFPLFRSIITSGEKVNEIANGDPHAENTRAIFSGKKRNTDRQGSTIYIGLEATTLGILHTVLGHEMGHWADYFSNGKFEGSFSDHPVFVGASCLVLGEACIGIQEVMNENKDRKEELANIFAELVWSLEAGVLNYCGVEGKACDQVRSIYYFFATVAGSGAEGAVSGVEDFIDNQILELITSQVKDDASFDSYQLGKVRARYENAIRHNDQATKVMQVPQGFAFVKAEKGIALFKLNQNGDLQEFTLKTPESFDLDKEYSFTAVQLRDTEDQASPTYYYCLMQAGRLFILAEDGYREINLSEEAKTKLLPPQTMENTQIHPLQLQAIGSELFIFSQPHHNQAGQEQSGLYAIRLDEDYETAELESINYPESIKSALITETGMHITKAKEFHTLQIDGETYLWIYTLDHSRYIDQPGFVAKLYRLKAPDNDESTLGADYVGQIPLAMHDPIEALALPYKDKDGTWTVATRISNSPASVDLKQRTGEHERLEGLQLQQIFPIQEEKAEGTVYSTAFRPVQLNYGEGSEGDRMILFTHQASPDQWIALENGKLLVFNPKETPYVRAISY